MKHSRASLSYTAYPEVDLQFTTTRTVRVTRAFARTIPSVRLYMRRALALGSVVPHVHPVLSIPDCFTPLPPALHSDACFPLTLTFSCVLTCLPVATILVKT
jgi:hypothetical protein